MKLEPKRNKKPLSTALSLEAHFILNALAEKFQTSKVEVLEQLLLQYGRKVLKRDNGKS